MELILPDVYDSMAFTLAWVPQVFKCCGGSKVICSKNWHIENQLYAELMQEINASKKAQAKVGSRFGLRRAAFAHFFIHPEDGNIAFPIL